jgi:hypothetical protein
MEYVSITEQTMISDLLPRFLTAKLTLPSLNYFSSSHNITISHPYPSLYIILPNPPSLHQSSQGTKRNGNAPAHNDLACRPAPPSSSRASADVWTFVIDRSSLKLFTQFSSSSGGRDAGDGMFESNCVQLFFC